MTLKCEQTQTIWVSIVESGVFQGFNEPVGRPAAVCCVWLAYAAARRAFSKLLLVPPPVIPRQRWCVYMMRRLVGWMWRIAAEVVRPRVDRWKFGLLKPLVRDYFSITSYLHCRTQCFYRMSNYHLCAWQPETGSLADFVASDMIWDATGKLVVENIRFITPSSVMGDWCLRRRCLHDLTEQDVTLK